jgi:hypothetical protein
MSLGGIAIEGGSVALGWGAYADRKSGETGYDPLNANTKSPVWISTAPAVSVGRIGVDNPLTRQIIGVAAGSEDTDAVNVAQLKNAVLASKVHYYGVNSSSTASGSNYNNEGAVGKNSLAAGAYTSAEGKNSIAIGSGKMNEDGSLSYYKEKDGSKTYKNVRAAGEGAIAIGSDIKAWNEGNIAIGDTVITSGSNATAIGKKTVAGAHSVAIGDMARTGDNYSIAIGYNAGVSGFSEEPERNKTDTYGVAIGPQAYSNFYSVALGNANAAGWYATALGYKANASRDRSTALGPKANASGVESIAIGPSAISSGNKTVGIGSGAHPTSDESITIGTGANSSGVGSGKDKDGKKVTYSGSISIGTKAESDSYYSVTLGTNSHTVSEKSIALGYSAHTTGKSSIAEGDSANSVGTYSTAIGAGAETLSTGSIAIGHDAKANNGSAENSIALGTNAVSQGNGSIALGVGAAAYNGTNIAIGQNARVAGTYSHSTDNNVMAIGNDALASGAGNIAIGYGARSTSSSSSNESEHNILAIGNGAKAVGNGAVALGYNTDAWMEDSVVLGSNSQSVWSPDLSGYDVSTGTNSNDRSAVWKATNGAVSVGRTSGEITVKDSEGNETTQKVPAITRRIANVAAGVYDEDAVNVAQLRKMAEKVDSVSGQHTLVTVNDGTSAPIYDTTKAYTGKYSTDGNLLIKATTSDKGQTTFDIKMNDQLVVGKAGKDGVNGKDGSIGINGKDGKPGTDGKQGITTTIIRTEKGQDGAQGEPGQQGAPGVDGSNITRIVYENGENGKDGNDGKHIVATLDDGLKFGANAPATKNGANPVANKLNTTVEVKGAGDKALENYSGKNLYTTVSQDGDGKTTINVLMDKDISGSSVTAGERGKNGTDGKDGKDGVDGSITIINGKPGTNGTDGLNGQDGKNASSEIHTHYGPVSLNDDKNVELENGSKAMTRIHYVDQAGKDHEVATMDDGLYFTGNNTDKSNKHYLNSTVKVQGEGVTKDTVDSFSSAAGNVAVVADGNDTLTIKLNKDLNLGSSGSVTMGNTVINNGGMTITKTEGGKTTTVSLTDGGLNNGDNQIINVASGGDTITNAANIGDVKKAKTEVKAGNHITVTPSTDTNDGHAIYTVSADLSALGGMSGFNVANNGQNSVTISDGNTVDFVNGKNTTAVVTKKTDNPGVDVKYDLADDIVMGKDGKDGKPGKDGSIGLVGKDGKDGQDRQSYTTTIIKTIGKNGTNGEDGIPGVDGKTGADGKDGITRIIYQDGKDGKDGKTYVVATLDDGLKFGANAPATTNDKNPAANKMNSTINITGAGTKSAENYSGENLYTTVSQATDGTTTINVLMDKDLKGNSVTVGTDGKDGTNGVDGKIIIKNGKDGKDGADAGIHVIKGADGVNGTNGQDGITRIVYNDGKDGKDGTDHVLATLDDGMMYAGDNGQRDTAEAKAKVIKKQLNQQLDIVGGADPKKLTDNNIGVNNVDGKLKVQLAQDLTGLNSIIVGDTTNFTKIEKNGFTINNGPTITTTNVSFNNQQIHNVKAGEADTDAVNVSQLNEVKTLAGKHTLVTVNGGTAAPSNDGKYNNTYSSVGNLQIKANTTDGQTTFDIKMNDNLVVGKAGRDGVDGKDGRDGSIGINGKDGKIGQDGRQGITTTIIKTEKGEAGAQGEPGQQGAPGVDGTNITRIVYENGENGQDGKDGKHIVATLEDGMKYAGDDGTDAAKIIKKKLNEQLDIIGGADSTKLTDNNIGVNNVGGKLKVQLAQDLTGLNSIIVGDTTNFTKIEKNGFTINNGPTITTTNVSFNNQQIHNVKAGEADTDVVNVSQLKEAISHINTQVDGAHNTVSVGGQSASDSQTKVSGGGLTLERTEKSGGGYNFDLKLSDEITVGKNGKDGADGKVGVNGKDGTTIVIGKDAVPGKDGKDGINGISIKGEDGKSGVTIVGPQGENGMDGYNGIDGKIGISGRDGKDAVSISGKDGVGHIGLTGPAGTNGKDGKSIDISVKNGYDGQDGTKGAAGVDGKDGITRIVYEDKTGEHQVATLDDGMKYSGDTGNQLKMKLNSNVNINGGATEYSTNNNIAVVSDGNDTLNLRLAKDISGLNSVTSNTFRAGDTTNNYTEITSGGITIKNGDDEKKNISITNKGINMGGQQIHNVAPGTAGNDVATVSQITNAEGRISKLNTRLNRVGAGAAALAALHPQDFDPDDKWDIAAGYGNYRDANAAAVGAFYHPNEDTMISIGGSVGGGENMVNAGISIKLGQGNHVTTSRVAMAREILEMKQKMEKLEAQNEYLMNRLGAVPEGTLKDVNFPDVPKDHWAYQYVKTLADKGYITGYPDGTFKGDRAMTRYEYAAVIYRALQNGAPVDEKMAKVLDEFEPELDHIQKAARFRVDRISGKDEDRGKVERVRVNNDQEERDVYGGKIPAALKK